MGYVLHIDGDAFFASCEASVDPRLVGRPVVTGGDRSIATAMSYEAKALGVTRAMPIWEIKKRWPQVIVLPTHFRLYRIFSNRMVSIVRRHVPEVESYSIDECFADLSFAGSVSQAVKIARRIKRDLETKLGMTFSFGIGSTKVLAKIGSKWKKPDGFTVLAGKEDSFLAHVPIEKIWGIGPSASVALRKKGIATALDFAKRQRVWVEEYFSKPHLEIWYELNGVSVMPCASRREPPKSISSSQSFQPLSDKSRLWAELSAHAEDVCDRLRREGLIAARISFHLKTKQFDYHKGSVVLPYASAVPASMLEALRPVFEKLWRASTLYRAVGMVAENLRDARLAERDLFGQILKGEALLAVYEKIDGLSKKYGRAGVFVASSLAVRRGTVRPMNVSSLNLPLMGEVG